MHDGNDYGEPKTPQHRRGTQAVLNESWPLSDKAGGHAREWGYAGEANQIVRWVHSPGPRRLPEHTSSASWGGPSRS